MQVCMLWMYEGMDVLCIVYVCNIYIMYGMMLSMKCMVCHGCVKGMKPCERHVTGVPQECHMYVMYVLYCIV